MNAIPVGRSVKSPFLRDTQEVENPDSHGPNGHSSFLRSYAEGDEEAVRFPTHVLPEPLFSLVEIGSAALSVPPDLIAGPALAITGALIGPRQRIRLKRGFEERAILWVAVVSPPGAGKTPAQNLARRPLDVLQREAAQRFKRASEEYTDRLELWERDDKKVRGPKPEPPTMEDLYVVDITWESLADVLARNAGVPLIRDEIVSWVKSNDAYRGGKGGDRQNFLSAWSGVPIKVNRRSKPAVFIDQPTIGIVGGIQPDMLLELADEAGRRDGFLERILWLYPPSPASVWTEDEVPDDAISAVTDLYRRLRASEPAEQPISFAPDAKAHLVDWYNANSGLVTERSGLLQGVTAKLPVQLARLTMILHCLRQPTNPDRTPVSLETLQDGIELVSYFVHQAEIVFTHLATQKPLIASLEARIRRLLERAEGDWVRQTALHRGLGGHVASEEIAGVLSKLLEDQQVEMRQVQTGGRPSTEWRPC